jgi:hypothetical protein
VKRIDLMDHHAGTLRVTGPSPSRRRYWLTVCTICEKTGEYRADTLTGPSPSARCECRDARIVHGACATRKTDSGPDPHYDLWQNIKARVRRQSYGYELELQPEWRHFTAFRRDIIAAIGPRPSAQHSLDRVDPFRGYINANLRWGTAQVQANNKRSTRLYKSPHYRAELSAYEWMQYLVQITGDPIRWTREHVEMLLQHLSPEELVAAVHPARRTPQELARAQRNAMEAKMEQDAAEAFAGWTADL